MKFNEQEAAPVEEESAQQPLILDFIVDSASDHEGVDKEPEEAGKLNYATQAIPPAPLFYRNLQQCLLTTLEGGTTRIHLPIEELNWWPWHLSDLTTRNGRCLLHSEPHLKIETDASTIGWGKICQGV